MADPVDRVDHPRRANEGIAPARHRGGPGMRLLPRHGDLVPALALRPGDDPDREPGGFEDRPLLDMSLEIRRYRVLTDRRRPGKADALQFGAERQVGRIVVAGRQSVIQPEHPGEDARADHRRGEPRALLVGPRDDLYGRLGLVAEVVQGAHHLEPGHHPIGPVEPAPGGLGIEVAAGHDRRQIGVAAGPAGKDVADSVHRDAAAGRLAPVDEEAPRLAVEVARGEPAHPALLGRTDPGQLHQARPQPLAVHRQIAHVSSSRAIERSPNLSAAILVSSGVVGQGYAVRRPGCSPKLREQPSIGGDQLNLAGLRERQVETVVDGVIQFAGDDDAALREHGAADKNVKKTRQRAGD